MKYAIYKGQYVDFGFFRTGDGGGEGAFVELNSTLSENINVLNGLGNQGALETSL